jgi:hypothetical protein
MSTFDEIRAELGEPGSASMAELLTQVESACGVLRPYYWIDRRTRTPEVTIKLFIISPGTLHRVSGTQDAAPDPQNPDEPIFSACEYRALPITHRASFVAKTTLSQQPTRERARCKWTFNLGSGHKGDILTFAFPESNSVPAPDEDGMVEIKLARVDLDKFKGFAGAFAREIVTAQRRAT